MKFLTAAQVADLLQVSERSVKRHSKELGGFYPAGIRVLRFMESDVLALAKRGGVVMPQVAVGDITGKDPGRHGL